MPDKVYIQCVIATPLHMPFTYTTDNVSLTPGCRVEVPFGRRNVVAMVASVGEEPSIALSKIKPIIRTIDANPLVPAHLIKLARTAVDYYKSPPGEMMSLLFPALLRKQAEPLQKPQIKLWRAANNAALKVDSLTRAPKQRAMLERLIAVDDTVSASFFDDDGTQWRSTLKALEEKHLVTSQFVDKLMASCAQAANPNSLQLTDEQGIAANAIKSALGQYQTFLLEGITGSGKTEVYIDAARECLARGQSVLVLVPEIGLTPQLTRRFAQLGLPMATLHSGLTDQERLNHWLHAQEGHAKIVIGTRSAVFTPVPDLGLIMVDEEHDISFKQQSGLRYSARDLAVWRASIQGVPVVLGTATPSLESLHNVNESRYQHLTLHERPGSRTRPTIKFIDMRKERVEDGISETLRLRLSENLARGDQSLLFVNRRGFAPALYCTGCGWVQQCNHCDARLTLHRKLRKLKCHHCGWEIAPPPHCPQCNADKLQVIGQGTERVEAALDQLFPDARIARLDRDAITTSKKLTDILAKARNHEIDILLGTQMLAKGHDFPNVTLCAVIDADQGLFGTDFRAAERLAQLLIQVAGRAGRADKPGTVCIQTHLPEHPTMQAIGQQDYAGFAASELAVRAQIGLPPYRYFSLFIAESRASQDTHAFLQQLKHHLTAHIPADTFCLGPVPAMMERRAGYYRMQLLLQSKQRADMHTVCSHLMHFAAQSRVKNVRYFIDIDPYDLQ